MNAIIGKYISGSNNRTVIEGKFSNLKIALFKPLPKLHVINIEGIIPMNVPMK
jgi:hypothetical protein